MKKKLTKEIRSLKIELAEKQKETAVVMKKLQHSELELLTLEVEEMGLEIGDELILSDVYIDTGKRKEPAYHFTHNTTIWYDGIDQHALGAAYIKVKYKRQGCSVCSEKVYSVEHIKEKR